MPAAHKTDPYPELLELVRQAGLLSSVSSLLHWDLETCMPPNGLQARADQLSLLAELHHRRWTDPEVGKLLERIDQRALDPDQAACVREIRRTCERAVKIPADLVKRMASVAAVARNVWAKARVSADFPSFAPHLKELLDLKRQEAMFIGFEGEPYDALLDGYEPGSTALQVAEVFSELRSALTAFAGQLLESPRQPDDSILHRHFPRPAQEKLVQRLADAMGFDLSSGRIDASVHPFCSSVTPGDVRLTAWYQEDFLSPSIFSVLHEAGHGLYEQGLPADHAFTPLGTAVSLGIHESQSRMWENMVGRSRAFWQHFYSQVQASFPEALGDVALEAFVGAINVVRPSPIRVEADELTYNLHIILRFELERDMFLDRLDVTDIPEAWNARLRELLGITPADDGQGCLQDIHWSVGGFGYFPTYSLGNLYAAQFYAAAERDIPDLEARISRGELGTLLEWLRENIHRHGQRYRAAELVRRVTGSDLSIEPFMTYVRGKFRGLYGL